MTTTFQPSQPSKENNMQALNKTVARNKFNKQGGFTLTELVIVLAIVALIGAASTLVVPRIMAKYRATKITDAIAEAIPAIQVAKNNTTSFSDLTTAQVAQNGWINDSFIEYANGVPTGNLMTQWGTIAVAPTAGNQQGQITMTNIPSKECTLIGNSFTSGLILTGSINGSSVKNGGLANVDQTLVGTTCSSSATNTIVLTFGRA